MLTLQRRPRPGTRGTRGNHRRPPTEPSLYIVLEGNHIEVRALGADIGDQLSGLAPMAQPREPMLISETPQQVRCEIQLLTFGASYHLPIISWRCPPSRQQVDQAPGRRGGPFGLGGGPWCWRCLYWRLDR